MIIATIPAGVLGLLIKDYMEEYFNTPYVVAAALIIYGFAFIWIENRQTGQHDKIDRHLQDVSYTRSFKIGLFQALSLIPGTSRSGSTILGGLLLGMDRTVATEFSFFMSMPVMLGASLVKLKDFGLDFSQADLIIQSLLKYIRRNDFKAFGYYRIILGTIVILYYLFK